MVILKKPSGLAEGVITDDYSKISGLSATLHANRVRTAAISGKTSAKFSALINDLRGMDPVTGTEKTAFDTDYVKANTGLLKDAVVQLGWLSERALADHIQKLIKTPVPDKDAWVNILLPQSIMLMIPEQSRDALAYGVARYLAKARLILLEAAFPGAAGLLFKVAENQKDEGGMSHKELESSLTERK